MYCYAQKNIWKDTHQNEGTLWETEIASFYFYLLDTKVFIVSLQFKNFVNKIKTDHDNSNVVQNAMKSLTFKRQKKSAFRLSN